MYQLKCMQCNIVYMGKSGRAIKNLIKFTMNASLKYFFHHSVVFFHSQWNRLCYLYKREILDCIHNVYSFLLYKSSKQMNSFFANYIVISTWSATSAFSFILNDCCFFVFFLYYTVLIVNNIVDQAVSKVCVLLF